MKPVERVQEHLKAIYLIREEMRRSIERGETSIETEAIFTRLLSMEVCLIPEVQALVDSLHGKDA